MLSFLPLGQFCCYVGWFVFSKVSFSFFLSFCRLPMQHAFSQPLQEISHLLTLIVVIIDNNCRYKFLPFGQSLYLLALAHFTAAQQPSPRQCRHNLLSSPIFGISSGYLRDILYISIIHPLVILY